MALGLTQVSLSGPRPDPCRALALTQALTLTQALALTQALTLTQPLALTQALGRPGGQP